MSFDWTITIGNLIAAIGPVLGFIITGLIFINKIGTQVALIDQRMGSAETDLKDMASGIRQLAADNTQIVRIVERETASDRRLTDFGRRLSMIEERLLPRQ